LLTQTIQNFQVVNLNPPTEAPKPVEQPVVEDKDK